MKEEAKRDPEAIRLQTAPGIGPVSAMAIKAFGPDMNCFKRGRDFAAWLELVPLQKRFVLLAIRGQRILRELAQHVHDPRLRIKNAEPQLRCL